MRKAWHVALLMFLAFVLAHPGSARAQKAPPDLGPLPVTVGDPSWGNADAPVTLVVFTDLQCPFCKRLATTVGELERQYGPKKLRVVHKHYPLPFHVEARPAAEAAEAVRRLSGNAAFWKFTDAAFANLDGQALQGHAAPRGGTAWHDVARTVGIDIAATQKAIDSGAPGRKVDEDMALAGAVGVRGTPASFINGVLLSGAQPKERFVEIIDQQLAEATALRARGVPAGGVYVALAKQNFQKAAPSPPPTPSRGGPTDDTTTVWKVPVGRSPARGPVDALVTLVVFSEFQCPFCGRLAPTLEELAKRYPTDLRIVFKNNPLPFHQRAEPAAELALEAFARRGPAGFWDAHDRLFAQQTKLEEPDLEKLAADLGLVPAATMQAVRQQKHRPHIETDQELADDLDADGTPTSFINGRRLSGARPLEAFVVIVDEELAKAQAMVAKGTPKTKVYDLIITGGKTAPPAPLKSVPAPTAANPSRGAPGAPVTIQMFTDFECPFCARAMPTLERVQKELGGKVRLVYRHLPLDFHQNAMAAHEVAMEAFRQGGNAAFWRMHDRLFQNQGALDRASLLGYAAEIGLDVGKVEQALSSGLHRKAIEADKAVADKADIRGTPGFVINGYFLSGAQPFEKFRRVINAALQKR